MAYLVPEAKVQHDGFQPLFQIQPLEIQWKYTDYRRDENLFQGPEVIRVRR